MEEGRVYRPHADPPTRDELENQLWIRFAAHDEMVKKRIDGHSVRCDDYKCVIKGMYEEFVLNAV
jgi:hypothetical protein